MNNEELLQVIDNFIEAEKRTWNKGKDLTGMGFLQRLDSFWEETKENYLMTPKWQDKPDEEGWWAMYSPNANFNKYETLKVKERKGVLLFVCDDGSWTYLDNFVEALNELDKRVFLHIPEITT